MKAVVITKPGGAEVLEVRDVPTPEPGTGHIRVRVRAAGLNRADLLQRQGKYPAPPGVPAEIPGLEFSGTVDRLGPECSGRFQEGDRVFGIVGGAGNAEFVVMHEWTLVRVPDSIDLVDAGAVPEVFFTAFDALTNQAKIRPGESVLIHAVGGGVGSAAVQLAHVMGCRTFGTSRTSEKLDFCRTIGLDVPIQNDSGGFAETVLRETENRGVEVIIDHLGAPAWSENIKSLSLQGRMVLVGTLGGAQATIDLSSLLQKRLTVVGTVLRSRPLEEKIQLARAFEARVIPWLADGRIRPVIDRIFEVDAVREAHERMAANLGIGKILLTFPA